MSITREFFDAWLRENVGSLPAETEVSVAVLAQQFEQDADAAGYGADVREDEIGSVENAIEEALAKAKVSGGVAGAAPSTTDLEPIMEALEVEDAKSGP